MQMNIKPEDLELIEAYLNKKLESDQLEVFSERLNQDESFKSQYEFVLATRSALRAISLEEKKELLQSIESNQKLVSRPPNRFIGKRTIFLAAASIILIVASIFVININSINKSVIDQQFIHVDSDLVIKRSDSGGDISEKRLKAYSLYEVKAYNEAAPLLLELFSEESDTASLYFAGISYLASYKIEKAKTCLSHPALENTAFDRTTYLQLAESASR